MKIEDTQLLRQVAPDARKVDGIQDAVGSRSASRAVQASGDSVALSTQASQVEAKVEIALKAPETRNYLVDLARQLQQEGKLGQDLDKLADRLIDSVLEL